MIRAKIRIKGFVQGIGFRPFVYRIAREIKLKGFVTNNPQGVEIEVEGDRESVEKFLDKLKSDKPALSKITSLNVEYDKPAGYREFFIKKSTEEGKKEALILPEIATCDNCLSEIFDPKNRRFRYPFTNCTNCGPRFSIIEDLPYDRKNTSMKIFKMCPACMREYEDPGDRRFHAQPNACPVCGPYTILFDKNWNEISKKYKAIIDAANLVKKGRILALKGLGGYQLIVSAIDSEAVRTLRERKHREEKPFAVMFPSLEVLKQYAHITTKEIKVLTSYQSPIVLVRKGRKKLAENVSPYNEYIGAMLPYTPLHHLLLNELGLPVVCTSGNISEEPMIIDDEEARERLSGICDYFLSHGRPIVRPVDDSVVRVEEKGIIILRRARGYAPMPIESPFELPPLLAVGAHLKNTISVSQGNKVFISQHIGDLETIRSYELFRRIIDDFLRMYEIKPIAVCSDAHPDYISTKFALSSGLRVVKVFHHHAHIASCMLDNGVEEDGEVLGVSWDGTGFGEDRTIWGGEFLLSTYRGFKRVGTFKPFLLIGGERAIKEPRRALLAVLYEIIGDDVFENEIIKSKFNDGELTFLKQMVEKKFNVFKTTSAGRLFDAVASAIGLKDISGFEGQPPLMLEGIAEKGLEEFYPFEIKEGEILIFDWTETILAILEDIKTGKKPGYISAKFHNTLAKVISEVVYIVGYPKVALSGGCFQNIYLSQKTSETLLSKKFKVLTHKNIPPNDGGISAGQVVVGACNLNSPHLGK